ncbi:hypothetical protein BCR34DRAFT_664475 [Clohesyomyces aquaticus]|uniref:Uncharacterized protein n=1 Tax=Clohesyomyces aquaticus TaxID=1231657 RepID=A0A1Y1ZM51_9PLEO|nr:hypothetical protein BCR34DRAFT_664475 [Clohesyomyces aquaticus]
MGIPYSREINAAFEQVTPLVAAGFEVLRTTRNISILLAAIQVLTVLLLALILLVLVGILYSVNPDLEQERRELVSPVFGWLARLGVAAMVKSAVGSAAVVGVLGGIGWVVWPREEVIDEGLEEEGEGRGKNGEAKEGGEKKKGGGKGEESKKKK